MTLTTIPTTLGRTAAGRFVSLRAECGQANHTSVRENDACVTGISPQWAFDAYREWKALGLPSRTWVAFYTDVARSRGAA